MFANLALPSSSGPILQIPRKQVAQCGRANTRWMITGERPDDDVR